MMRREKCMYGPALVLVVGISSVVWFLGAGCQSGAGAGEGDGAGPACAGVDETCDPQTTCCPGFVCGAAGTCEPEGGAGDAEAGQVTYNEDNSCSTCHDAPGEGGGSSGRDLAGLGAQVEDKLTGGTHGGPSAEELELTDDDIANLAAFLAAPAPPVCEPACAADEECVDGVCQPIAVVCEPACAADEECVDGACQPIAVVCEPACEDGFECVEGTCQPEDFVNADPVRGGLMYDKWWAVAELPEPAEDHPLYPDEGEKTGSTTHRCKECHGWDYKGVNGAYATGSHFTGIAGIFGTEMGPQDVFDRIGEHHGFADMGLTPADLWNLARFVLDGGQVDIATIINDDKEFFTGDVANGETLYNDGIGGNANCATCHGADGEMIPFDDLFVGSLARDDPWEVQHKIRFGQPGTGMPAAAAVGASLDDIADVGAYSQTLSPE